MSLATTFVLCLAGRASHHIAPSCKAVNLSLLLTQLIHYCLSVQETVAQVGTVSSPIEGLTPESVPGETELTQALYGMLDDGTYLTRGYNTSVPNLNMANTNNDTQVEVGTAGGVIPASDLPSSSSSSSSPATSSPSPSSSGECTGDDCLACYTSLIFAFSVDLGYLSSFQLPSLSQHELLRLGRSNAECNLHLCC